MFKARELQSLWGIRWGYNKKPRIPPERAVILEFESVEAAKNAYNSEDYQAALKKLDGGADRFLFVIEGA